MVKNLTQNCHILEFHNSVENGRLSTGEKHQDTDNTGLGKARNDVCSLEKKMLCLLFST